jgi:hypothetical protein
LLLLLPDRDFESLDLEHQSRGFDVSDHLFCSINEFALTVLGADLDFREMTPEFFFLPDVLLTLNGYDLGIRQAGRVNDVKLPGWSISGIDCIYQNRKALSNAVVSASLNLRIDLL